MTLCIIDMQEEFSASEDIVPEVVAEVLYAIEQGEDIVVIEYGHGNDTWPEIREALNGYEQQATVIKDDDDGGEPLVKSLKKHGFCEEHLRFCGVNTCWCVADTIRGTQEHLPSANITLLDDSCNCSCRRYNDDADCTSKQFNADSQPRVMIA